MLQPDPKTASEARAARQTHVQELFENPLLDMESRNQAQHVELIVNYFSFFNSQCNKLLTLAGFDNPVIIFLLKWFSPSFPFVLGLKFELLLKQKQNYNEGPCGK